MALQQAGTAAGPERQPGGQSQACQHLVVVVAVAGAVLQQAGLGTGLAVVAQPRVGRAPMVRDIGSHLWSAQPYHQSQRCDAIQSPVTTRVHAQVPAPSLHGRRGGTHKRSTAHSTAWNVGAALADPPLPHAFRYDMRHCSSVWVRATAGMHAATSSTRHREVLQRTISSSGETRSMPISFRR